MALNSGKTHELLRRSDEIFVGVLMRQIVMQYKKINEENNFFILHIQIQIHLDSWLPQSIPPRRLKANNDNNNNRECFTSKIANKINIQVKFYLVQQQNMRNNGFRCMRRNKYSLTFLLVVYSIFFHI